MKKILIVEDDNTINNLIREILEKERYKIYSAYSGTEALIILERENIDLILLDLMLPGINGEQVIEKVKDIPIIVISAKVEVSDKVNALLKGANDYITKPFCAEELIARVKVQLRNYNIKKQNIELKYKDMTLREDEHILNIKNEEVYLTKTECLSIKQLLLNPENVVTKSKILDLISNDAQECDEGSLKVHISNIRKKIKKVTDKEYIESVWGIGFKLKE